MCTGSTVKQALWKHWKQARNQGGNLPIAPRNFQNHVWLLGTTSRYNHFAPLPRKYCSVATSYNYFPPKNISCLRP